MLMHRAFVAALLILAGCSRGHSSDQQNLSNAADQSTPEAAQVLNGAARNGMDVNSALNEAANAQAANTSTKASPRLQARPNSAAHPNPKRAGLPPDKIVANGE